MNRKPHWSLIGGAAFSSVVLAIVGTVGYLFLSGAAEDFPIIEEMGLIGDLMTAVDILQNSSTTIIVLLIIIFGAIGFSITGKRKHTVRP